MPRHVPIVRPQFASQWNDKSLACDGKKRYATAALALSRAVMTRDRVGKRLDVYPCNYCGAFHLTGARRRT